LSQVDIAAHVSLLPCSVSLVSDVEPDY